MCSAFRLKANVSVSAISWHFVSSKIKNECCFASALVEVFVLQLLILGFLVMLNLEFLAEVWFLPQHFRLQWLSEGRLKSLILSWSVRAAAIVCLVVSSLLLDFSADSFFSCSLVLALWKFPVDLSSWNCFDVCLLYVSMCDASVHTVSAKNRCTFLVSVLVELSWNRVLQVWSAGLAP